MKSSDRVLDSLVPSLLLGGVMLLAPAAGMALGGLLATQLDLAPGRLLKLTAIPLGVGLICLYAGGLAESDKIPPATALVGTTVALALTALFTSEPPEDTVAGRSDEESQPLVMVSPTLLPAGRRNEGMATGAALLMQF